MLAVNLLAAAIAAFGVSGRSAGVGVSRALVHPVGTHVEDTCRRNTSTMIRAGQMVVFVHRWQNSHLRRK